MLVHRMVQKIKGESKFLDKIGYVKTSDSKTKDALSKEEKERLEDLKRQLAQAKQIGGDREYEKELEEEIEKLQTANNDVYTKGSKDSYTGDSLTSKGKKIMTAMKEQYGKNKGKSIFYASKNKGVISGVDGKTKDEKVYSIKIPKWEGDVRIVDNTHCELKADGTNRWTWALHIGQLEDDMINALKAKGAFNPNGRFFNTDSKTKDSIEAKVIEFFKQNPNPDDDKVHQFTESNGINPHELEEVIYALLSKKLTGDKKTSDKYILVWQNDKYEIYEDENNEYELVRKSNKAVIGQYATLQGAKLDTKDTYEPMNTKNIAAAKALSKARGMAATDKNSHPHWKIKGDKLSVKAIGDKKTKDEMNLSQALMQAKRELYPGKDYHLLSSEENMDVTIRARDILRESKKTKDSFEYKGHRFNEAKENGVDYYIGYVEGKKVYIDKSRGMDFVKAYIDSLLKGTRYENWKDSKTKDEMKFKKGNVPDDQFDKDQLAMGIKVEMEHTDDPEIAKQIAKAHLSEIGDYYTRLKKLEQEAGVKDRKTKDAIFHMSGILTTNTGKKRIKVPVIANSKEEAENEFRKKVKMEIQNGHLPQGEISMITQDRKMKDYSPIERIEAGDKLIYSPTMRQIMITRITKRNANGEAIEVEGKFTEGDVKIIKASELLTK